MKESNDPKLKAIIVDDETSSINALTLLLQHFCPQVELLATANSFEEAHQLILTSDFDLLFLDIEIGAANAFDLLKEVDQSTFHLVFISAHDHALKSYQYQAVDYLLKPIEPELLQKCIEKIKLRNTTVPTDQEAPLSDAKVSIPYVGGIHIIPIKDIIHIEGDGNYTAINLIGGKKIMTSKIMKYFEDLLPTTSFQRVHTSHIIQLDFVKEIRPSDEQKLLLNNGTSIPIARRRRPALIQLLKDKYGD